MLVASFAIGVAIGIFHRGHVFSLVVWLGERLGKALDSISGLYLLLLILVLVFQRHLRRLMEVLVDKLQSSEEFRVEVKGITFQFAEAETEERPRFLSPSPLEYEPEPAIGNEVVLYELAPQLQFTVSDYMGRKEALNKQLVEALDVAKNELEQASLSGPSDPLRRLFDRYVGCLERLRFFRVEELLDVVRRPGLDGLVKNLRSVPPSSLEDSRALLALGTAHAQLDQWKEGRDVLAKLVSEQVIYAPAAHNFIACEYNQLIADSIIASSEDLDTNTFHEKFAPTAKWIERLQGKLNTTDWSQAGVSPENFPYYKREFLKTAGLIYSILADHMDPARRESYLNRGRDYLIQCVETIDGEEPSALDYSNLADLYRQQRVYEKVYETLDAGEELRVRKGEPNDPIFSQVRAETYWSEGKRWLALHATQEFPEREATRSADVAAEHVKTQVLAAKLAYSNRELTDHHRLALSLAILEQTKRFAEANRTHLEDEPDLLPTIYEMLGAAYFRTPGREREAVDALQKMKDTISGPVLPVVSWERGVRLARAKVRLARALRRQLATGSAKRQREDAQGLLSPSATRLTDFPLQPQDPVRRLRKYLLLHLDATVALLELAEEAVQQADLKTARDLLEGPALNYLLALMAFLDHERGKQMVLGDVDLPARLRHLGARRDLVLARVAVREERWAAEPAQVDVIEQQFQAAEGLGEPLNSVVQLECGEFLLAAAERVSRTDLLDIHDRAIARLERATAAPESSIRALATRELARAYSMGARVRTLARRQELLKQKAT